MPSYSFSEHIKAPPARVFELFTDIERAPEHVSGIKRVEVLTEGGVKPGMKWRETREFAGREATETLEITALEPNKSYRVDCDSHGAIWRSDFRFTPDGDGTRVDLEMRCLPQTLKAKIMSPLSLLFAGMLKKAIRQDLDDLKRAAESGGAAGVASREPDEGGGDATLA